MNLMINESKERNGATRRTAAFTLIEALIAIFVFSIVLAAINSVFFGALKLRNKAVQSIEDSLPLNHALEVIKKDLAGIVPPGGTINGQLQTSLFVNNLTGQASPDFYTNSGRVDDTTPWAETQRIAFLLVNSTNGTAGRELVRATYRNLLPVGDEQPDMESLVSGVDSVLFQYYDGAQWMDSWDSTTSTRKLPSAIRFQLTMAAKEGEMLAPTPIEMVVPLLVDGGTNSTTSGTGGGL